MADMRIGLGYCHVMPSVQTARAAILRRWESFWRPLCALHAHRDGETDPAAAYATLQDTYLRRISALIAAQITWKAIHASNLDDPRRTGTEFDRALCLAIERRRCRMGRRKGKGKKYAKIYREPH